MQSFTLKPSCRLEKTTRVWDTHSSSWKTHYLKIPRWVDLPKQELTEEQNAYLKERATLLSDGIRLDAELRRHDEALEAAGPDEFVAFQYKILLRFGFAQFEDADDMKRLIAVAWDLVDRLNGLEITWAAFRDEVECVTLHILNQMDSMQARRRPVRA